MYQQIENKGMIESRPTLNSRYYGKSLPQRVMSVFGKGSTSGGFLDLAIKYEPHIVTILKSPAA